MSLDMRWILVHAVGFQGEVQAGEAGGTSQGVGGEGVAVEKGSAAVVAQKGVEILFGGAAVTPSAMVPPVRPF